jgi:hypothetical protein
MFFFGNSTLETQTKKAALACGVASLLDIGGDVTSPYLRLVPYHPRDIIKDFATDYDRVVEDYAGAVDKVVERSKKK